MMVVIITSHASIKYCVCKHVFLFEDTGVCPVTQCQTVLAEEIASSSYCEGCCRSERLELVNIARMIRPDCSNCMVNLHFSLDDCLVSSSPESDDSSLQRRIYVNNHFASSESSALEFIYLLEDIYSPRGSPPPIDLHYKNSQALFVHYSAWLI